jgi:hypothetical protein
LIEDLLGLHSSIDDIWGAANVAQTLVWPNSPDKALTVLIWFFGIMYASSFFAVLIKQNPIILADLPELRKRRLSWLPPIHFFRHQITELEFQRVDFFEGDFNTNVCELNMGILCTKGEQRAINASARFCRKFDGVRD